MVNVIGIARRIIVLASLAIAAPAVAQDNEAAAGASNSAPAVVSGAFIWPKRSLWAGEVFDLTLDWRVEWSKFQNLDGELDWQAAPLIIESLGKPAYGPPPPGQRFTDITQHTRAMALIGGPIPLRRAAQAMVVQTGVFRTDDYARAITGRLVALTTPATLTVRPLPPAPADFLGTVGSFRLSSSVDGAATLGKPLHWTLTLSGLGSWPMLRGMPTRQVSADFDIDGQPRTKEAPGATMFERSSQEVVTLIPRHAGQFTLGPVSMHVFDPAQGAYVVVTAPAIAVSVAPNAAQSLIPTGSFAPNAGAADNLPPLLKGSEMVTAPLERAVWRLALALPVAIVLLCWLALAFMHARSRDPHRLPRLAYRGLTAALDGLMHNGDAIERRKLVRAWQDNSARWLGLAAVPVPASFAKDSAWHRLWAEADHYLYGRDTPLPPDWQTRAQAALAERVPPPSFSPVTMLRRKNLFPLAGVLALAVLSWSMPAPATQPPAEGVLRAELARQSYDWKARYNLAIVLARQGYWNEAAGQAAAAWVQHPASKETRALWSRAASEAGFADPREAGILRPDNWRMRAAAMASPAIWQRWTVACAWIAAMGTIALLLAVFGHVGMVAARIGAGVLVAGTLAMSATFAGLHSYGLLADPNAVIVWRESRLRLLPVDTLGDPSAIPLSAGTIGQAEGHFLNWRRVSLSNGSSGWIRNDNLTPVWASQAPPG
jgi:hypothetical protein